MTFSPSKHFWTWFQRNSNTLLEAQHMNKKEEEYWLRELTAHLRACSKKLSYIVVWSKKGISRFIISAEGIPRYFDMAEKFAAKAPVIPGWEIIALRPPGLMSQPFMEECAIDSGFNLHQCWFLPPDYSTATGKALIKIYTKVYTNITDDMNTAIYMIVMNLLGEKAFSLRIEDVELESIYYLSEKDKKKLIGFDKLPQYTICGNQSTMAINEKGDIIERYE